MTLITEEQYAVLHPHLPVQRGNVRIPNRIVVSALIYVLENRCSWRALPTHFGKWHTVYMRLHRWDEAGVLGRLIDALREQQLIGADIDRRHLDSIGAGGRMDGTGTKKCSPLRVSK